MNTSNTSTQKTPGPRALAQEVKLSRDWLLLGTNLYAELGSPSFTTVIWNPIERQLEIRRADETTPGRYAVAANASGTARIQVRPPIAQSGAEPGIYHAHVTEGVLVIAVPDGWQAPFDSPSNPPSIPDAPLILSLPQVAVLCDIPYKTVYYHVQQGYAGTVDMLGDERTARYMTIEQLNAYRAWRSLPPLTREEIEQILT